MDNNSFIKMYRKFLSWEWYSDIVTKILFLHLLLLANWRDKKWQGIIVKRGQLISTPEKLSHELGLSIQQVKTAIMKLKRTGEITTRGTNKFTTYTLMNYNTYQNHNTDGNQQNKDQLNTEQLANNKQLTTLKEKKEVKNFPLTTHPEVNKGDMSKSGKYQAILDYWKEERDKVGLSTRLIGDNSKGGAMRLASAIGKSEITLDDARRAIRNLLTDTEKRKNYTLNGLANNFEIWLNRSTAEKGKSVQLNKTVNLTHYSGKCEKCNYPTSGFEQGLVICQKCGNQIELREEK